MAEQTYTYCPTCGCLVRAVSTHEGTSHYVPANPIRAAVKGMRQALAQALAELRDARGEVERLVEERDAARQDAEQNAAFAGQCIDIVLDQYERAEKAEAEVEQLTSNLDVLGVRLWTVQGERDRERQERQTADRGLIDLAAERDQARTEVERLTLERDVERRFNAQMHLGRMKDMHHVEQLERELHQARANLAAERAVTTDERAARALRAAQETTRQAIERAEQAERRLAEVGGQCGLMREALGWYTDPVHYERQWGFPNDLVIPAFPVLEGAGERARAALATDAGARVAAVLTAARTWAAAHQAMEPDEPLTIEEARARLRAEYQAQVALVAAVEALGKEETR